MFFLNLKNYYVVISSFFKYQISFLKSDIKRNIRFQKILKKIE